MLRYASFGYSSLLTPWLPAILGAKISLSYPPKTVQFLPSSSEFIMQRAQTRPLCRAQEQIIFMIYVLEKNIFLDLKRFETV
jgi:hypothetical protein